MGRTKDVLALHALCKQLLRRSNLQTAQLTGLIGRLDEHPVNNTVTVARVGTPQASTVIYAL
eukprot:NODE_13296_length_246_cov_10.963351.p1 GENE.NODE_13296_length_246_cov_10.963351~~NODE_13296_length_246_cov_10.963351.p1  ORF type:complete len:62 (+),score=19.43 NODE_13296_length_246_cov_10.963351:3-188(+)